MPQEVFGLVAGIGAQQRKALEKLYGRRMRADVIVTAEFAYQLTYLSDELNRKVGVLVDRRGHVEAVTVGDAHRAFLPDIGRQRAGSKRLRGLRYIVTSVVADADGLITHDELTDLTKLRLDMVVALEVGSAGRPGAVEYAQLLPEPTDGRHWERYSARTISELPDGFEAIIKALEDELERKADRLKAVSGPPAILVHLDTGERDAEARLGEMKELCRTAGVQVVQVVEQRRHNVDPRYVVGSGKLDAIELIALHHGAELLIFDRDLTPTQSRAITQRTEVKVIDRTQLILDIFAQRATSHDGKLQVELAQLKYALPKLVQKNTAMSRLTGGIGGRGPGETKLEINRRRARDRIHQLEKLLEKISKQRQLRRQRRGQREVPVISLVGYTNAGKSTLLNTLTNAEVLAENKLFATLDPTSRRLRFPREREVVLTDTVGFIRDLPRDLVAAFKATLEELDDADVLVHIVDIADPHFEHNIKAVDAILTDLSLEKKERVLVFNKADLLDKDEGEALARGFSAIACSALQPESIKGLLASLDELLWRRGRMGPEDETPDVVVQQL